MFAKHIMTSSVVSVTPDTPVKEIAETMNHYRISGLPVLEDDGTLVGIISEGDLVHRARGDSPEHKSWWLQIIGDSADTPEEYVKGHGRVAADLMTRDPITVTEFTSGAEIAELIEKRRIKRVPVVDRGGAVVGIVSRANLVRWMAMQDEGAVAPIATVDADIRSKLVAELQSHHWYHEAFVNVQVAGGVVQLWGLAGSEKIRRAIVVAAENTPGVKSVEDNLQLAQVSVATI